MGVGVRNDRSGVGVGDGGVIVGVNVGVGGGGWECHHRRHMPQRQPMLLSRVG